MSFGSFASFEVLVLVLGNRVAEHSRPNLLRSYMLYSVPRRGKGSPMSTKGSCAEELLNRFFYQVRGCSYCVVI